MTYHTTIRHQELVSLLGSRNLYLRLVYAHIANYTQVKGAWCGTQRDMAKQLELPVGTVNNQLAVLLNRGLVVREMNKYRSADEQNRSADEQICSADESPHTPLYNKINNKMERNENIARATMHDAHQVPDPSFDDLLKIYKSKAGDYRIADAVLDDTRRMWALYPEWKKRMLLMHIREGKWLKPRLDWTVSDFDPQPKNLGGSELGGQMLNNHTAKIACYNGSFGVYSLEDIKLFDLKEPKKNKDELR